MTFVKPDVSQLYKKIDFVTVYGYTSGGILRVRSVRGRSSCNKSARSFILIVKRQLISKGKCVKTFLFRVIQRSICICN